MLLQSRRRAVQVNDVYDANSTPRQQMAKRLSYVIVAYVILALAKSSAEDFTNGDLDLPLLSPNTLVAKAQTEVVPAGVEQLVIDLGSALRLAQAQNPRIALAREMIIESIAQHKEARARWMPTLAAGTNYHYHTGVLQTSFGEIRQLNEQSIYFGGGSRTLAAESVAIPAVRIFAHVGDAFYQPLAARQMVTALLRIEVDRQSDIARRLRQVPDARRRRVST